MRSNVAIALFAASAVSASLGTVALCAPRPAAKAGGKAPASKTPPACGAKAIPLAVGNQWTYTPVAAPNPLPEAQARLMPQQPSKVIVAIKAVDTKAGETTVSLEETLTTDVITSFKDGAPVRTPTTRTLTTTIVCSATKFDVSPEAFWFAGEPGGFLGLKLDKLERVKGTTWALTGGTVGQTEWREDLAAHWTQVVDEHGGAKPTSGKLELERRFIPQQPESIGTPVGAYNAEKVALSITGRVTLDAPLAPESKPYELPANWVNTLWLVDNVGVVQVLNAYAHMYTLADVKLK
jgi:hypothetical protein